MCHLTVADRVAMLDVQMFDNAAAHVADRFITDRIGYARVRLAVGGGEILRVTFESYYAAYHADGTTHCSALMACQVRVSLDVIGEPGGWWYPDIDEFHWYASPGRATIGRATPYQSEVLARLLRRTYTMFEVARERKRL